MYLTFYNLTEQPFNVTPDPKFLYMTQQHGTALNHLLFAIRRRKGFVLLTGEVGTGKTTLCRKLLERLGPEYHTALVLNPMLTATQLLRGIVEEFGVECNRRDRLGYLTALNSFLLEASSKSRDTVLIIDEAQDMSVGLLEMVRLLSNLETNSRKLLQIVLSGQPELRAKLRRPTLRQLTQRITVSYHLSTMSRSDTAAYISHRLSVAGNNGGLRFDDGAVDEIYEYSGGTPRLINTVGDKALLAAYVKGASSISGEIVRTAIGDLNEVACEV